MPPTDFGRMNLVAIFDRVRPVAGFITALFSPPRSRNLGPSEPQTQTAVGVARPEESVCFTSVRSIRSAAASRPHVRQAPAAVRATPPCPPPRQCAHCGNRSGRVRTPACQSRGSAAYSGREVAARSRTGKLSVPATHSVDVTGLSGSSSRGSRAICGRRARTARRRPGR